MFNPTEADLLKLLLFQKYKKFNKLDISYIRVFCIWLNIVLRN